MSRKITAVAWTLVIVALCSLPPSEIPAPDVVGVDKLAHFAVFAVFAWLWLRASNSESAVRNVLIAGFLLAMLTEMYQGVLPFERDPSMLDAVANLAGLLAGIVGTRLLERARAAEAR